MYYTTFLYIGPGLGVATIVIVLIVLLIIFASLIMILWTPIKSFVRRTKKMLSKTE